MNDNPAEQDSEKIIGDRDFNARSVDEGVCERQCVGAGFVRSDDYAKRAGVIMNGVLRLPPHDSWTNGDLADWTADPFGSRNWQFQHHALRWLAPVRHLALEGDKGAKDFWISLVRSWVENNPPEDPPSKFSWVDMADGLRAQELVFGWPLAESDTEKALLMSALHTHGEWLADPEHQATGNHALHQNVGLFVLSSFLRHESWQQIAVSRIESLFDSSFDIAGANDEGSMDYHRMNLSWWRTTWKRISVEGIKVPDDVQSSLSKAATFLAHATRPDGTAVPLGDTHLHKVQPDGWAELEYVSSGGLQGEHPATTVTVAPNGYVLGRSGWGTAETPYSDQSHYSIRYGDYRASHQHEDRGGVTFYAGHQDWITDPGSYLYEPSDPFRKYLRSRDAHNLVIVNGVEYDQSARVTLESSQVNDSSHDYIIVDSNYSDVELTRRVVYLTVLDLLVVLDHVDSAQPVTSRQIWHTDADIKPRYRDSALELQKKDGSKFTVQWLGAGERPKVTYGDDGSVHEWVSRKWGQKAPAAGFEVSRTSSKTFYATVLGDSTRDAWAISSSRVKPNESWIRIVRFGRVWSVTIGDKGTTVEEDKQFIQADPVGEYSASAERTVETALLRQRLQLLEREVMLVNASHSEKSAMDTALRSNLETEIEHLKTTVSSLKKKQDESRVREQQRVAALLPTLPDDVDPSEITGGLDIAEVLPHIKNPLYLHELWLTRGDRVNLNLADRRKLARDLYQRGYMARSLEILRGIAAITQREKDIATMELRASELEMMRGNIEIQVPPVDKFMPETGRIMHVVGKAIPETQTGYTLRTHYIGQAQQAKGYDVHVMRQAGGSRESLEENQVELDAVTYHLPKGPVRGTVNWDDWLHVNSLALYDLVGKIKPSLLHCHSDFINQIIAKPVADAYGIPLIYESRGFWEESWLSRVETQAGRSLDREYDRYGLPDTYVLRQGREDEARRTSDHVTTLADVMKHHIVERGEDADRVSVAPNGVQPAEFPVVNPDVRLKRELGIPESDHVIGYITSVVEYEGIDTLINAFSRMRQANENIWLLLVGDGPVRKSLEQLAKSLGVLDRTLFTGRIPHEQILSYYSLIDLFVVPRKDRTVCRLVTPLKPFEALSTGRTVVVSDVDALKEISEQSNAVETFAAQDAESLTNVLQSLLADPERRKELSRRGSEWARDQRSWEAIASMYDDPYEKLGVRLFDFLSESAQQIPDLSEARRRRQLSSIDNRAAAVELLQLHGEDGIPTRKENADQIIDEGWAAYGFSPVSLNFPIDWSDTGPQDRSWQMHFHCWEFMHAPLVEWARSGQEYYLSWCVERALGWAAKFDDIYDDSTMAWYDMAVAYRTMVLVTLVRSAAVSDVVSDEDYQKLLHLAIRQRDAHWLENSFNPRNNHGYYSALSQIVLGREFMDLPGMGALQYQGDQRLRVMTEGQFTSDGGHSEHSPDYHRMLLSGFDAALAAGLIDDPKVAHVISRAADALGWMVQPDGNLVQFGDSAQRKMWGKGGQSSSDTTRWVLTGGLEGKPTEDTWLALPQTGYVFVREPAPKAAEDFPSSSYLAFTSAFHSRAHKHCDDNSMIWFEQGQQILADGGRYRYGELLPSDSPLRSKGFYYADPIRQYMESAEPHSTVSIDSSLHDRRRRPHGSGIVGTHKSTDGAYAITASTPQSGWVHEREILFYPARKLVIKDSISIDDPEKHSANFWWHFDGSLSLEVVGDLLYIRSPLWHESYLEVSNTLGSAPVVFYGSEDPLAGWRSRRDREKEASWSVRWTKAIRDSCIAETTMEFKSLGD